MKKQIGLMTLSLLLVSTALAGGAGAPAPKTTTGKCQSIAQLVASNPQLSTLNTAVDAAGLKSTLAGSGSYTLFAPTDTAFAKVPSDQLASTLNDPAALRSVLLYHVVAEKATAAQIRGVQGGTTVQGADITVSASGNTVKINNATVTRADLVACNGIVHLIDTVLMPPAATAEAAPAPAPAPAVTAAPAAAPAPAAATVVVPATPLNSTATATTTEAAAAPATTTETTTTQATTETTATTAAPATTETTAAATTTDTSAATTTTETAAASTTTTETAAASTTTQATATTTTATTTAATTSTVANTQSMTVYEVIQQDDRFSTLRSLISDAGLEEDLSATGSEFTILAPTDEAFDTLPENIIPSLSSDKEALKKVLQYHVIGKRVAADALTGEVVTVQGGVLDLGAANVGQAVAASNGVIYPIDVLLLPPDFVIPEVKAEAPATTTAPANVVAYLSETASTSTFRSLLTTAGLADTLAGGTYTVLAPSNDAFAKVNADALAALTKDKAKLTTFLQGFIVEGSPDLVANPVKTLAGTDLVVTADGTGIRVGEAKSVGDMAKTDAGNVYVLDAVTLP